jgi:DNA-binding NarL/FixJ family response regulator
MGAPYETSRARIELARALAALGRADDARAEASRAIEALEAVHASGELAKARAVFDGAGAAASSTPKPAPRTRAPTASLLTAREREVLALVAEGLSNPAIGERLFVSEHTVHRHVANILTKLDVPSRAAAVAEAARRNLL